MDSCHSRARVLVASMLLVGLIANSTTREEYILLRENSEKSCLISRSQKTPNCTLIRKNCMLYYFHGHKTGGTSICKTANNNQFITTGATWNCNIPPSVKLRNAFIRSHNLTFVAQEAGAFKPVAVKVPKPLYFTTVRNPADRILSHVHHGFCLPRSNEIRQFEDIGCKFNRGTDSFADVILSPCFDQLGYTANFYVRRFGGCMRQNCTEDNLQQAIDALHAMSVIVITEDFERYGTCCTSGAIYARLLSAKFGLAFRRDFRSGTIYQSNATEKLRNSRSGALAYKRLAELNDLDMRFYEEAKRLANIYYERLERNASDPKCWEPSYFLPKHAEALRGEVDKALKTTKSDAVPRNIGKTHSGSSTSALELLCVQKK